MIPRLWDVFFHSWQDIAARDDKVAQISSDGSWITEHGETQKHDLRQPDGGRVAWFVQSYRDRCDDFRLEELHFDESEAARVDWCANGETSCTVTTHFHADSGRTSWKHQETGFNLHLLTTTLVVFLHWQRPRPIKNALCRILWRCSHCSETEIDANFHWVLYTFYWYINGLGLGLGQCK